MYLAIRNQAVLKRSVISTMKVFKEMGYGGMELSMVRGLTDVLAMDYLDDYMINKINEVSEELSFPITALACHQNYVTSDFTFEVQKKLLKTAPKYNTDLVIVSTFVPDQEKEDNPELYDELVVRTKELCNVAEENGVKLVIEVEPHQLFQNLKTFFHVAEKVNSPAFKLNFDVGHMYLSEVDLEKAIDDAKDFIVYSHIENMYMGEHAHKLPWDGEIDLLSVYRKLKETCYDGPVSLDLYLQDYEEVAPKCLEYINREVFSKL
jgi:sugar phosphate isomerase/epimerase